MTSTGLIPIVFVGPSGVGKGTLIGRLEHEYPARVSRCVSHTTRQPRASDRDGIDYHFVSVAEFERLAKADHFVETALVHTNWYGTSVDAIKLVESSSKLCLLDLNIEGCSSLLAAGIKACLIFIAPPSMEALESRLLARKTEDESTLQLRLETAAQEMTAVSNQMWDHVLVNDDLDSCYNQVKECIKQINPLFFD